MERFRRTSDSQLHLSNATRNAPDHASYRVAQICVNSGQLTDNVFGLWSYRQLPLLPGTASGLLVILVAAFCFIHAGFLPSDWIKRVRDETLIAKIFLCQTSWVAAGIWIHFSLMLLTREVIRIIPLLGCGAISNWPSKSHLTGMVFWSEMIFLCWLCLRKFIFTLQSALMFWLFDFVTDKYILTTTSQKLLLSSLSTVSFADRPKLLL